MTPIAVIIPCHNLGRMVEECLASVLDQTRPASEIVIVDAGSTDLYTRQVLSRVPRSGTRVVHTPHHDPAAARNHGIRVTSAPYVVTLDADCRLAATYLESTAGHLDASPDLSFVSTGVRALEEAHYSWTPPACSIRNALTRGTAHAASMFRRRMWEEIGGFDESPSMLGCEDIDFWLSAMTAGNRGAVLPAPLLLSSVRADSIDQWNVAQARPIESRRALLRKHRSAIEAEGTDLLIEWERIGIEQERYLDHLEARRAEKGIVVHQLDVEIQREIASQAPKERVDWGDLNRLSPISPYWGTDRGMPIDRYYIGQFLDGHRADVQGHVLEVKDASYARNLSDGAVTRCDVLDIDPTNPHATIVADLSRAGHLRDDQFDCFILTQTLHIIYDIRAAVGHAARLLKPGGVLLCTLPALSRVNYEDGGLDGGDFWRLTAAAVRQLFAEAFPLDHFEVATYGNLKACTGFLYGLACEDLAPADLSHVDPWFPLIHCVRAVKPRSSPAIRGSESPTRGAVLLYHRVAERNIDPFGLCIPPERFRRHMQHLKANCELVPLADLVAAAASGSLPDAAVAVTFDDAYLDNLTAASPILTELGIPATFFATTGRLEGEHEFWWDTLVRLVMEEPTLPAVLRIDTAASHSLVNAGADRERVLREIHGIIRVLPVEERENVLSALAAQVQPTRERPHDDRPMTADELRRLASLPGHTVGAHTRHHLDLPFQPTSAQWNEISGSRNDLQRLLGCPVAAFAYPFGHATDATAALVADAGYQLAVTVRAAPVDARCERLLIPRAEVLPSTDLASLLASLFNAERAR